MLLLFYLCNGRSFFFFSRTRWKCSTRVGGEAPSVKLPPRWRLRKWGTFSELFSVCKDHNLRSRCLCQDLSNSPDRLQLFFLLFPVKVGPNCWLDKCQTCIKCHTMKAQAAKKGGKGGKTAAFFVFILFVHSTKCLRILPPLSITWLQQLADFYFRVWSCVTPEVVSSITPGRRTFR